MIFLFPQHYARGFDNNKGPGNIYCGLSWASGAKDELLAGWSDLESQEVGNQRGTPVDCIVGTYLVLLSTLCEQKRKNN